MNSLTIFNYEVLRVAWWLLLGVLLMGFAAMDGFDLGVAMLLPFTGKTDTERRVVINSIGPVWEGNQVWLILGAGAIFAAWPQIYAVAFSGFYLAMFLALCALILRPVGMKYRSKLADARWRAVWDWLLFAGGLVPALVFGVAVGNTLQGVPFRFDDTLRMTYTGGLIDLFNPFALLCGLISVAMLVMHGGAYLALKVENPMAMRARRIAIRAAFAFVALFAVAGLWTAFDLEGYRITGTLAHDAASNPLGKHVVRETGAWLANYRAMPWTIIAPAAGFAGALIAALMLHRARAGMGFIASAAAVKCTVATAGLSMFPFILPSSLDPNSSLTVWDASSSRMTLAIMLVAVVIFMPIILAYTAFVFHVLRGTLTAQQVEADEMSY